MPEIMRPMTSAEVSFDGDYPIKLGFGDKIVNQKSGAGYEYFEIEQIELFRDTQ